MTVTVISIHHLLRPIPIPVKVAIFRLIETTMSITVHLLGFSEIGTLTVLAITPYTENAETELPPIMVRLQLFIQRNIGVYVARGVSVEGAAIEPACF